MPKQLPLPFAEAPTYAAADFIAAPSNALARDFLARPGDWSQGRMVLWGEPGSGKTHLARIWAERHAAAFFTGAALPPLFPLSSSVVIDDVDSADETALFHWLNAATEALQPVLLTARNPPARAEIGLPDLASRLRASLAVQILPPDDDLLGTMLGRLAADRQLVIPPHVQSFLLTHLSRTPAAVRDAVARLDMAALAAGGRVTRALAAAIVAGLAQES